MAADIILRVEGAVHTPLALTLDDLQREFPAHTRHVRYLRDDLWIATTFTGALLWDILSRASAVIDPHVTDDQLSLYVLATGRDGFPAVFGWGEIDPEFGNHPVLVAYAQEGQPIADQRAPLRLVVPNDKRGGRYVGAVNRIFVGDAAPNSTIHL